MKRIARSAILPHAAAEIYALVDDVERYPQFLPWCEASEVLARDARMTRARLTVGMKGLKQSFTTQNDNRPGEAIDLRLVEGPFRHFAAAWRFVPLEARACKVEFSMEYEFASRAIATLLQPLFARMADSMVEAFTRRADEVYGTAD